MKRRKTNNNGDKSKKNTTPKVSYHYKPENMTLEQWQVALRQQVAAKESFNISEDTITDAPGYYTVKNHTPEATKQLVDSIVKVDEKTGETSLHIPIPNKESVTNVLGMLGKLFG